MLKRRQSVVCVIDRAAREERVEESIIDGGRVVTGCHRTHSCSSRLETSREHPQSFEGKRKECWTEYCSCRDSR